MIIFIDEYLITPPTHTHTHTYTHDKTVKWMSTALLWLRTTWMKLLTQNRSPIAHLHGWAMGCLLSVFFIHWGQVTHLCISKLTTIGLDNGLLPGRHQTIIWTMLEYCKLDPSEQTSVISLSKFIHFYSSKCIWKYHLENGGHFVSASIC